MADGRIRQKEIKQQMNITIYVHGPTVLATKTLIPLQYYTIKLIIDIVLNDKINNRYSKYVYGVLGR